MLSVFLKVLQTWRTLKIVSSYYVYYHTKISLVEGIVRQGCQQVKLLYGLINITDPQIFITCETPRVKWVFSIIGVYLHLKKLYDLRVSQTMYTVADNAVPSDSLCSDC